MCDSYYENNFRQDQKYLNTVAKACIWVVAPFPDKQERISVTVAAESGFFVWGGGEGHSVYMLWIQSPQTLLCSLSEGGKGLNRGGWAVDDREGHPLANEAEHAGSCRLQGKKSEKKEKKEKTGQRGDVGWEWGIPVSNEASDAAGPSWPSPPTTHLTCPLFSVHAPGAHNVFGFLYLGIFASRMHPTAPAAPTHLTCSLLTRWAYNAILEFLFLTCLYMHHIFPQHLSSLIHVIVPPTKKARSPFLQLIIDLLQPLLLLWLWHILRVPLQSHTHTYSKCLRCTSVFYISRSNWNKHA